MLQGGGSKKGTPTQILNLGSLSKCMFTINIYKYKEREGGGGGGWWGYPNSFRVFAHTRHTRKAVGTTSSKPPLHPPPYHPRIFESLIINYMSQFTMGGGTIASRTYKTYMYHP